MGTTKARRALKAYLEREKRKIFEKPARSEKDERRMKSLIEIERQLAKKMND
jgi:hypothetical protein